MKRLAMMIVAVGLAAALSPRVMADVPGIGPDEASGVQNRRGDASPAPGFTSTETNSRVDDYINQDEQIYLDKDAGVVKVLRTNQKALINDFVTELVPVTNPNALTVSREMRNVFRVVTGKEGGRAEVVRDKVTGQSFLQVICPRFQLEPIRKAIAALDVPWLKENADGFATYYYKAKFRPIGDVDRIANAWADSDAVSQVDVNNNAAFRRDEPFRMEEYKTGCAQADLPPPQIMLEGAIYEVNMSNDLKLGLDYVAWKNGPGRNLFEFVCGSSQSQQDWKNVSSLWSPFQQSVVTGTTIDDVHSSVTQHFASFNALLTSAYMDFLASKGKARVVARPKIVARCSCEGVFTSTDQVLGFVATPDETTFTSISNDISVANRTLNYSLVNMTTGDSLDVIPMIGLDSSEVSLALTFKTIAGTTPQGTPIINTRTLVTKVRVRDGQAIVLSGLARNENIDAYAGVPFLSRIPLLGLLFGGENHSNRETDFVLVLTPKIIQGAESDLATVEDVKTRDIVLGNKPAEMPKSPWGFDQWLLDRD